MIPLRKSIGYPQDFRTPGIDEVAEHYAHRHFGSAKVDKITENLHRSTISKNLLLEDLMEYDRKYATRLRDDLVYDMALESVRREMTPDQPLIPLTLGGVEKHPDLPKNRSPGLPWKLKGYKTKGDCLADPKAIATWHAKWDNIGRARGEQNLPDTALFLRAQIARQGQEKIRSVWGYPIDVIIEEGRTFYPYIDWVRGSDTPIAYHIEIATGGMQYINDMLHTFPKSKYVVADWSRFDKTIPPWLIRDAFSIIFNSFDFTKVRDSEGKIWPVNEAQSIRRAKRVMSYFINTPIRVNDGRRFKKTGGVPSGSMFTNIIDSIVNMIVTRYTYYHVTGAFPQAEVYLGDDSVTVVDGIVNLDDMASVALDSFGMVLNAKKSYVTTNTHNVHFIGYYNRDGKPFKPQDFAIASFIYPERNVDEDNVLRVARAVGQMWSTMDGAQAATWHGLIEDLMLRDGITHSDVTDKIRTSSAQFKYLRLLGIKTDEMTIPPISDGFVWAVEALAVAKRQYKRKKPPDYLDLLRTSDDEDIDCSVLYV